MGEKHAEVRATLDASSLGKAMLDRGLVSKNRLTYAIDVAFSKNADGQTVAQMPLTYTR